MQFGGMRSVCLKSNGSRRNRIPEFTLVDPAAAVDRQIT